MISTRVGVAQGVGHQLLVDLEHGDIVPSAQGDKLLHGLDIAIGMRQRHRFNRLAFKVQELSVQIGQGPLALFGTRKQQREVGVIGEQFVGERLHIARRQVDDRRLA